MRVAEFTSLTGPSGVSTSDRDDPEPESGEAVVDVEAASLNHHDLRILQGGSVYVDEEELPFLSGLDLVGEVSSVGDGVTDVAPGDRVLLYPVTTCGRCRNCREGPENRCENFSLFHGAFAERAAVPAADLIALPEAVDAAAAATLPSAYLTAWRMLDRAHVTAGDRVLVPGATGGVGVATVQLAGVLGATSVGTSGSPAKLDRLSAAGADEAVAVGSATELAPAVSEFAPFDAVANHLGGQFLDPCLDLLGTGGRMVVCGVTAGAEATIDVTKLFRDHTQIVGSSVGTKPDLERLVELVANGDLSPVVGRELPLAEAERAFRIMGERDVVGKIVLRP